MTELAPTSSSIEGHLSRCYCVAYNSLSVLKVTELLDSVKYPRKSTHDAFLPEKREKEMPAEYTTPLHVIVKSDVATAGCQFLKNDVLHNLSELK